MIAKAMDTFQQNIKKLGMSMLSYFVYLKNTKLKPWKYQWSTMFHSSLTISYKQKPLLRTNMTLENPHVMLGFGK